MSLALESSGWGMAASVFFPQGCVATAETDPATAAQVVLSFNNMLCPLQEVRRCSVGMVCTGFLGRGPAVLGLRQPQLEGGRAWYREVR